MATATANGSNRIARRCPQPTTTDQLTCVNDLLSTFLPLVRIEGAPAEPRVGERCEIETVLERLGALLENVQDEEQEECGSDNVQSGAAGVPPGSRSVVTHRSLAILDPSPRGASFPVAVGGQPGENAAHHK